MLTAALLDRYLLATAVTFGLLALLGWLAARYGPRLGTGGGPALAGRWAAGGGKTFAQKLSLLTFLPGRNPADELQRLHSLPLTPQHQLHKIRDGQRVYLLATHPHGATVLSSTLESRATTQADTHADRRADAEPLPNYVAPRRS